MKPVLFVVFFTLGVSLMIISGYVPQAATARSSESVFGPSYTTDAVTRISRPVSAPSIVVPPPLPEEPSPLIEMSVSEALDAPTAVEPFEHAGTARRRPNPEPAFETELSADPVGEQALEKPARARRARPRPEEMTEAPYPDAPTDEPAHEPPPEAAFDAPHADAGPDRTIWAGWDDIPLDGSASTGQQLAFRWRQTAGPVNTTIVSETAATTSATGLQHEDNPRWRPARYTFELTVTDAAGQQATDTVSYTVLSAPALRIRPVPERRFEPRDGYQLAVYSSWTTNTDTYQTTFEISSESELTFTRIGGGLFEVTGGRDGRWWVYQVLLTPQGGEPASWVEYLVDTDEKIPAVVQLGVNWEERIGEE